MFIGRVAGGILAAPLSGLLVAEAQQAARVPRIGVLLPVKTGTGTESYREGFRDLGYVEGRTAAIEWRWWEGKPERLRDAAADMVRLNPDVIVVGGSEAAKAMKEATRSIPIVFMGPSYPVEEGLVQNFARPGGNITGITVAQSDHVAKMLQLLLDVAPSLSDIGVIWSPANPGNAFILRDMETAARGRKLKLLPVAMANDADVESDCDHSSWPPGRADRTRDRVPQHGRVDQHSAHRRAGDSLADTVDNQLKSVDGARPAYVLRSGFSRSPTTHPQLCRPHSQRRKACRYAGRAAYQVRARHQHENREGDQLDDSPSSAPARGRGD